MGKKKVLWYYIKEYKFNSILIKNFFIYVLLVILPLAIIGFIFYTHSTAIIKKEIEVSNLSSLTRTRDISDIILREIDHIITNVSIQKNVEAFMLYENLDNSAEHTATQGNIIDFIKVYTLVHNHIDSIYVYSLKNDTVISNRETSRKESFNDDIVKESTNFEFNNEIKLISRKKNQIYPFYITAVKPIILDRSLRIGYAIINISIEQFGKLIKNDGAFNQDVYAVDIDGTVIYSDNMENITKNIKECIDVGEISIISSETTFRRNINGEEYIIAIANSQYNQLTYISLMPMTHFQRDIDSMTGFVVTVICLVMLAGFFVAIVISLKSFKPLKHIIDILDEDNSNKIKKAKNVNELKYIISTINEKINTNKEMSAELEHRLALLEKANFVALQAQINPHFLYNTLETINWMAIGLTNSKNSVSTAVIALGNLFRLGLENDGYLVTIRDELEHAQLYVELISLRCSDDLTVEWHINESILDYKIIKLCLQPLIENSVCHGRDSNMSHLRILVSGTLKGDRIVLTVEDNGKGMNENAMRELNDDMNERHDPHKRHIGARNINQRIKLVFGEEYGLSLHKAQKQGIIAKIQISAKK